MYALRLFPMSSIHCGVARCASANITLIREHFSHLTFLVPLLDYLLESSLDIMCRVNTGLELRLKYSVAFVKTGLQIVFLTLFVDVLDCKVEGIALSIVLSRIVIIMAITPLAGLDMDEGDDVEENIGPTDWKGRLWAGMAGGLYAVLTNAGFIAATYLSQTFGRVGIETLAIHFRMAGFSRTISVSITKSVRNEVDDEEIELRGTKDKLYFGLTSLLLQVLLLMLPLLLHEQPLVSLFSSDPNVDDTTSATLPLFACWQLASAAQDLLEQGTVAPLGYPALCSAIVVGVLGMGLLALATELEVGAVLAGLALERGVLLAVVVAVWVKGLLRTPGKKASRDAIHKGELTPLLDS